MSTAYIEKIYKNVPREQVERLLQYRATHPLKQLRIEGVDWSYMICGQGEKTILLPPGGERKGDVAFPIIQTFEQEYRFVYPSYPPVPTVGQLVDGLAAILAHEQIDKVCLLGGSFGGSVAQCFVRKYPHYVEKLILQNTGVPEARYAKPVQRMQPLMAALPETIVRTFLKRLLLKAVAAPVEERPFWQAFMIELATTQISKQDVLALLQATVDYRLHYHFTPSDLANWSGNILIIESEDDQAIIKTMSRALKTTYPQARIYTFHEGGHTPFLTHPEEYFSVVRNFLQGAE